MTEDEWLIHQERKRAALEGAEETRQDLERRRQARAEGREREWQLPQQPEPASMRQRRPYEPARARDWTAEQRWIEQIIDQRMTPFLDQMRAQMRKEFNRILEGFADGAGQGVAELLAAERVKWRAEIAASQAVLEKRIASLQKRLKAAEKQAAEPAQPRLVRHV